MSKKIYIEYSRPFPFVDDNDEPPIVECWIEGDKPKKSKAKSGLVYIYDDVNNSAVNGRIWDGKE